MTDRWLVAGCADINLTNVLKIVIMSTNSMPLLQIHYSKNLDDRMAVAELIDDIHRAALSTGEIPEGGLRTMALPHHHYAIADKNADNAFVHIIARMKKRDELVMRKIGDTLFAALSDFMDAEFQRRPLSLSLEFVEISTWRRNNMHA